MEFFSEFNQQIAAAVDDVLDKWSPRT